MLQSVGMLLLSAHFAASVFFHEKSSFDLKIDKSSSAYGFSLGYQNSDARLVIGAPSYNKDGAVYQCPAQTLRSKKKCNDPIDTNFKRIKQNRTLSPDQFFYLGASIAATKSGFVVCAPLRTDYSTELSSYGAFGVCVVYNNTDKTSKVWDIDSKVPDTLVKGGGGWSTLVDENHDRVVISQFFGNKSPLCSRMSQPDTFTDCFKSIDMAKVTIYGQAMTFGNYVDKNTTCYAFGINQNHNQGSIDFISTETLHYDNSGTKCPLRLKDSSIGIMFGAALCSADVTRDGLAELFVGAPAQLRGATGHDTGALRVYSQSAKSGKKVMEMKLEIWGASVGARFGTTLSTNDVNGDSYPEIIVSAPFEKSGGVLYIICGYAIHETIKNKITTINVLELERTQKIEKTKSFGYSLQPVTDYDENGSDELAVGAPEESTVTMYQGIRAVTANATSEFIDDVVSANSEFIFSSCVTMEKPDEPREITTRLLVKNAISGEKAAFKSDGSKKTDTREYEINLTKPTTITENGTLYQYCQNFTITSAFCCKVNTTISLKENIETQPEFNNSWVTLSAQSSLTKVSQPLGNCGGVQCSPKYSAEILWAGKRGSVNYMVGSSEQEVVSLVVHNTGTMGCGGCADVRVRGSVEFTLPCARYGVGAYSCLLTGPILTGTNKTVEIQLQTNTITNLDKGLTIDVEVRNECKKPEPVPVKSSISINYDYKNVLGNVVIEGTSMALTISEAELEDPKETTITVEQSFTILNNQSFKWTDVSVTIDVEEKRYIQKFMVRMRPPMQDCLLTKKQWNCNINLAKNSTTLITVSATVVKKELAHFHSSWYTKKVLALQVLPATNQDFCFLHVMSRSIFWRQLIVLGHVIDTERVARSLQKANAKITSSLALELMKGPNKQKIINHIITLEEKAGSPVATIFIAIGVALVVLLVIAIILYKLNFFKRKNKEELEVLKEMRNRSGQSGASTDQTPQPVPEATAKAVSEPDHDFDGEDLIVDETPLERSLSSEELNCIAANPECLKGDLSPKKECGTKSDGYTHL